MRWFKKQDLSFNKLIRKKWSFIKSQYNKSHAIITRDHKIQCLRPVILWFWFFIILYFKFGYININLFPFKFSNVNLNITSIPSTHHSINHSIHQSVTIPLSSSYHSPYSSSSSLLLRTSTFPAPHAEHAPSLKAPHFLPNISGCQLKSNSAQVT